MYLSLIKRNIDQLLSGKLLPIILVYSLYMAYLRRELSGININYSEFVLLSLTDHYYLLHFLILYFTFFIFSLVKKDETMIWIRSDTFLRYFLSQAISFFSLSSIIVLLHLFIALSAGFGLRVENKFSAVFPPQNTTATLLDMLEQNYRTPAFSLCILIVFMIIGLTFLGIIISFLNTFLTYRSVVICIIFLYSLMLLSIRSELDTIIPYVFINNYIILHHSLILFDQSYYKILISELIVLTAMLLAIKKIGVGSKDFIGLLRNKKAFLDVWVLEKLFSKKNVIIMCILAILMPLSFALKYKNITFNDLFILQFYGHRIGYFDIQSIIQLLVFNGTPIYLFGYFLEQELAERSSLVTIRIRHKKIWLVTIIKSSLFFIVSYVFLTVLSTLFIASLRGFRFSGYKLFETTGIQQIIPLHLIVMALSSKILELCFSFLFLLLLFCWTRGATSGFVLLASSYLCSLSTWPLVKYIPTGISSLSRLKEFAGNDGIPYPVTIYVLIASIAVLYAVLYNRAFKKFFD